MLLVYKSQILLLSCSKVDDKRWIIFADIHFDIFCSKTEQHEREMGRMYDEMDQLLLREKETLQEKVGHLFCQSQIKHSY